TPTALSSRIAGSIFSENHDDALKNSSRGISVRDLSLYFGRLRSCDRRGDRFAATRAVERRRDRFVYRALAAVRIRPAPHAARALQGGLDALHRSLGVTLRAGDALAARLHDRCSEDA